jgi:hypothetical protein
MCPVQSVTYVSGRSQSLSSVPNLNSVPFCSKNSNSRLPEFASNSRQFLRFDCELCWEMSSAKHGRRRFHVQKSDVIVWLGGEFAAINAAPIMSKGRQ